MLKFNRDYEIIKLKDNQFFIFNFDSLKTYKINKTSYHILKFTREKQSTNLNEIVEHLLSQYSDTDESSLMQDVGEHLEEIKSLGVILDKSS